MIEILMKASKQVGTKASAASNAAATGTGAASAAATGGAVTEDTGTEDTGTEDTGTTIDSDAIDYSSESQEGRRLPTREELATADTGTAEEKAVIQRGQKAKKDTRGDEKRQELRDVYEKERGKFRLTGKTIRVPSPQAEYSPAAYLGETLIRKLVTPEGEETIPDYEEFQSNPGVLFMPQGKSRKQISEARKKIAGKIDEFDLENNFPALKARSELLAEQIKNLQDPELERAVNVLTTARGGARPIQLDLTKQRKSPGIKIAKNKIGAERLNLYRQIQNAVRDESDNYISLDPMVIDQEIKRLKNIARPIFDDFESKKQERNRLRMAAAYYEKLLESSGSDVTAEE